MMAHGVCINGSGRQKSSVEGSYSDQDNDPVPGDTSVGLRDDQRKGEDGRPNPDVLTNTTTVSRGLGT